MSKEKYQVVGVQGILVLTSSNLEDGVDENDHVVLSVTGMSCVGCETKLQRSLATIKAMQNLETSLILYEADFDLDRRYDTIDSFIQTRRMTESTFEELKQDGSEIEVWPSNVRILV